MNRYSQLKSKIMNQKFSLKLKLNSLIILIIAFTLTECAELQAQVVWQVSLNDHVAGVMGDFKEKDMTNPGAGYVYLANGSNLEAKLYVKKLGIGIRGSVSNYQRDNEMYQTDLKDKLGISDNNYYFSLTRSYWSMGGDLGISYLLDLNEKFRFEPYFYFGFRTLSTPLDEVVYLENSTTYTYRKNPILIYGISYIPGLKFQWNVTKHVGLNVYLEYEGAGTYKGTEESVLYSDNTLVVTETDRSFKPQSINFGLGLAFSFGKGLRDK